MYKLIKNKIKILQLILLGLLMGLTTRMVADTIHTDDMRIYVIIGAIGMFTYQRLIEYFRLRYKDLED